MSLPGWEIRNGEREEEEMEGQRWPAFYAGCLAMTDACRHSPVFSAKGRKRSGQTW